MDTCVVLCTDASASLVAIRSLLLCCNENVDTARVVTGFSSGTVAPVQCDTALLFSPQPDQINIACITNALKYTKKGGKLTCLAPASKATLQSVARMSGLMGTKADTSVVLDGGSKLSMVSGVKPDFDMGAKASIALPAPKAQAVWKLDIAQDDDMLDEDDLLTAEDRQPVSAPSELDCSTGAGKKACKNCSCGRAEAEAAGVKIELTSDMVENPQSACGNCGLGDAFRCSTCPYRGLPKFEPGKKIQLANDFLTADA